MGDLNNYFTPLGKEYCSYFYYLSVYSFVVFWIILLSGLYMSFTSKVDKSLYMSIAIGCLSNLVFYFQNRLFYSMCVN